jgi:hypothetical protein
MKIKISILCAILSIAVSSLAQGTLSFRAAPDGAHAVPPNSTQKDPAFGTFTLDVSRLFSGGVAIIDYLDVTSVALFRSTSSLEVGARLYDFTPGLIIAPDPSGDPGFRDYDFTRTLTGAEATDLQSGLWWVHVITPGFPNGELRGQVMAVPEPSTVALVMLGACALVLKRRKSSERP